MTPFIACEMPRNHCESGLRILPHSDKMNKVSDKPSSFTELAEYPSMTGFHDVLDQTHSFFWYIIVQGVRAGFSGEFFKGPGALHVIFSVIFYLIESIYVSSYIYALSLHTKKIKRRKSRWKYSGSNVQCNPLQPLKAMIQALFGYRMVSKFHHCIIGQVEKDSEQQVCHAMIWFTERERFTKTKTHTSCCL